MGKQEQKCSAKSYPEKGQKTQNPKISPVKPNFTANSSPDHQSCGPATHQFVNRLRQGATLALSHSNNARISRGETILYYDRRGACTLSVQASSLLQQSSYSDLGSISAPPFEVATNLYNQKLLVDCSSVFGRKRLAPEISTPSRGSSKRARVDSEHDPSLPSRKRSWMVFSNGVSCSPAKKHREGNQAAHLMAHLHPIDESVRVWLGAGPNGLQDVLLADYVSAFD